VGREQLRDRLVETLVGDDRKLSPKPDERPLPTREEIEAAPWSSSLSLLKFATGWAGDDLDELLDEVKRVRARARF
jgi:hypothetical protein